MRAGRCTMVRAYQRPYEAEAARVRLARAGVSAFGFLVDVIYNLDVVEPGPVIVP